MDTIENIVREMRERHCYTTAPCACWVLRKEELIDLLDRIEAAYKRNRAYQESKCAANEELARKLTKQREINRELVDENSRLKEALKPILECEDTVMDTGDGHTLAWYAEYEKSVDEAKRIYNGWLFNHLKKEEK